MVILLNMAAIFSFIVSPRLQNDLHAFKINSSDIRQLLRTNGMKREPIIIIIIKSCICLVFYSVIKCELTFWFDGSQKEMPIISDCFSFAWFRCSAIHRLLSFLFLLTHIKMNFNLKK